MNLFFTSIFTFSLVSVLLSQTDSTIQKTEEILNDILIESESESESEDIYDYLENIIANPIDLNKADIFELTKIPGLDNVSAEKIIKHREKFGSFYSTNELYAIRDLNKDLIEKIIPFLSISTISYHNTQGDIDDYSVPLYSRLKTYIRSRITNDLQTRQGFIDSSYAGSKLKSYNRLVFKFDRNYQAGVLIEKDPGEKSFADFTSFHLQIKELGFLDNLVIGDYTIELGQGLCLWSPFGFAKGADAVFPVMKNSSFIRPYTSAAEFNFFRGAASTIKINDFKFTGFYSNKYIDAAINDVTNKITSISQTGFHRTANEILKKNNVQQELLGTSVDYRFSNTLNAGIVYYNVKFDKPFESGSLYDLSGDNFNYLSFYYNINFSKFILFGEASYNQTSVASVNGLQFAASNDFIFTTSVRSYPRNYTNLFGFGFGERSGRINNEVGFYSGFKLRTRFGVLNLYYDIFKFPYRTDENFLSSEGDELLVDFTTRFIRSIELRLRYKYENKEVTESVNQEEIILRRLKQTARTEFIYDIDKKIRLKTRLEYNNFLIRSSNKNENGFLIFQDIRFAPIKQFTGYARIIFFQTDSFNSAVYEFENDLVGVMPNLAMYGKGIRWYLMLRYKSLDFINISVKYSETYKPDETSLSSGDSEIIGNLDNRFSLQIDLSF